MLFQQRHNLSWLQDRNRTHASRNLHLVYTNKFRLQLRFTFLKKHCNNFLQIFLKLVHVRTLCVSTGPTRNRTDKKSGIGVTLNNDMVCFHGIPHLFYL